MFQGLVELAMYQVWACNMMHCTTASIPSMTIYHSWSTIMLLSKPKEKCYHMSFTPKEAPEAGESVQGMDVTKTMQTVIYIWTLTTATCYLIIALTCRMYEKERGSTIQIGRVEESPQKKRAVT